MIHQDKFIPDPNSGCWLWTASLDKFGYGQVRHNNTVGRAHRVIYEAEKGPIAAGLVLDHTCRNPVCVNPAHLEPVTQAENLCRSTLTFGSINASKTHCNKGHEFTPENTRPHPRGGGRVCLICRRNWQAEYRERKRVRS
jgi:hypothetical protein